ncbi:MAG: arylsulfatase [Cyclobacteriaceae bacterium]|nr:arylsulfatase [Cyclobacteriaceae bacterium SS2]
MNFKYRRQLGKRFLGIGVLGLILLSSCNQETNQKLPNIIFIFADDLGYGDLGAYNEESLIPTPNLDKLAAEGISLTNAYCPVSVCSPSRYALMTGTYPWRSWNKHGVLRNYSKSMMEPGQLTLPQILKDAGYVTAGFGKWHLGAQFPTLDGEKPVGHGTFFHEDNGANIDLSKPVWDGPIDHGFMHWVGFSCASECWVLTDKMVTGTIDHDFYTTEKAQNQEHIRHFGLDEYLPYVTDKSMEFLKDHVASKDDPFFLYYSPYVPHIPLAPGKEFDGKTDAGTYGDYVHELDVRIGQILRFVEENDLSDNTIIMFASDNGSTFSLTSRFLDTSNTTNNLSGNQFSDEEQALIDSDTIPLHAPNGILKGRKGSIWEGGVRTPFIAKWPGHFPAGQWSGELFALNDVMPTLASIVGFSLPEGSAKDAYDMLPVLQGNEKGNRPNVVVQSSGNAFGFRKGDYKFILSKDSLKVGQLYDLANDPSETNDIIEARMDLAKAMRDELLPYITEN